MKKLIKLLLSRLFIVGILIVLQIVWLLIVFMRLSNYSVIIRIAFMVLSILVALWIINKRDNPAYKLAWMLPILLLPLLGGLLYLFMGNKNPSRGMRRRLERSKARIWPLVHQDEHVIENMTKMNVNAAGQAKYLRRCGFPVYQNSTATYFATGEECYPVMLKELKAARHYIFMEYFIIGEGYMWDSILDVLKEKAANGVEVRLIYDDLGCVNTLPSQYYRTLQSYGIRCAAFNQFRPVLNVVMNNRDHRKITVIDGHTAFTGGINLADEYINKKMRFGHWKDSGVWLYGDAVWTFTVMFLQMWTVITRTSCDFEKYRPHLYHMGPFTADGLVQPYGDSPMDSETVGASVYLNIINYAKRYLYIFTPYLIPDNETLTALCQAAKRGVDVRIVTPEIPDKKSVFLVTQSYYEPLLEAGVRIYQYLPGFIHSKSFVCDDEMATCGTFNVDYRSLYLHFECGVFLYKNSSVMQIKQDALDTFEVSKEMDLETVQARNIFVRMFQSVLRLFAPML